MHQLYISTHILCILYSTNYNFKNVFVCFEKISHSVSPSSLEFAKLLLRLSLKT